MEKQNIFFVTYGITEKGTAYERLKYLAQDYDVYVFYHTSIRSELIPLCKGVYKCPYRSFRFDLFLFPFWVCFKCLLRKDRPIIFATFNNTALVTGLFLKLMGFKWVADIFDDPAKYLEALRREPWNVTKDFSLIYFWLTFLIIRRGLRKADLVVCSMVESILTKYSIPKSKICSVTNGVDLSVVNEVMRNKKARKKSRELFKIVYVGDMSPSRPIDLLLEGVTELNKRIDNILVLFVGDAPNSLQEAVRKSNISKRVAFLGRKERKDVYEAISESHVGLCLLRDVSDYPYTYPLKIFEYLALGCVVLATELPGIKRIIQHGVNGILIPPDDHKSLSKALLELHDRPALRRRLCINGRDSVKKFDWGTINHEVVLSMRDRLGGS